MYVFRSFRLAVLSCTIVVVGVVVVVVVVVVMYN